MGTCTSVGRLSQCSSWLLLLCWQCGSPERSWLSSSLQPPSRGWQAAAGAPTGSSLPEQTSPLPQPLLTPLSVLASLPPDPFQFLHIPLEQEAHNGTPFQLCPCLQQAELELQTTLPNVAQSQFRLIPSQSAVLAHVGLGIPCMHRSFRQGWSPRAAFGTSPSWTCLLPARLMAAPFPSPAGLSSCDGISQSHMAHSHNWKCPHQHCSPTKDLCLLHSHAEAQPNKWTGLKQGFLGTPLSFPQCWDIHALPQGCHLSCLEAGGRVKGCSPSQQQTWPCHSLGWWDKEHGEGRLVQMFTMKVLLLSSVSTWCLQHMQVRV